MTWLSFLTGILVGLMIALLIAKPAAKQLGYLITRVQNLRPARVVSTEHLQPHVKRLIEKGRDGERLYLWSKEPEFTAFIEKKVYKSKPDKIFLRVVHAQTPADLYERAQHALEAYGVEYEVSHTPKRQDPKHLQITFEAGPLAPATVSMAAVAVFRGVGSNLKNGILVSPWGNINWSRY